MEGLKTRRAWAGIRNWRKGASAGKRYLKLKAQSYIGALVRRQFYHCVIIAIYNREIAASIDGSMHYKSKQRSIFRVALFVSVGRYVIIF